VEEISFGKDNLAQDMTWELEVEIRQTRSKIG
jgi:hypothetical protein